MVKVDEEKIIKQLIVAKFSREDARIIARKIVEWYKGFKKEFVKTKPSDLIYIIVDLKYYCETSGIKPREFILKALDIVKPTMEPSEIRRTIYEKHPAIEEEIKKVEESVEKEASKVAELESRLREIMEKYSAALGKIKQYEEELRKLRQKVAKLISEREEVEKRYVDEIERLKKELEGYKKELELPPYIDLKEFRDVIDKLKRKIHGFKVSFGRVKKYLKEIKYLHDRIWEIEQRLSNIEREMEFMRAVYGDIVGRFEILRSRIEETLSRIESYVQDVVRETLSRIFSVEEFVTYPRPPAEIVLSAFVYNIPRAVSIPELQEKFVIIVYDKAYADVLTDHIVRVTGRDLGTIRIGVILEDLGRYLGLGYTFRHMILETVEMQVFGMQDIMRAVGIRTRTDINILRSYFEPFLPFLRRERSIIHNVLVVEGEKYYELQPIVMKKYDLASEMFGTRKRERREKLEREILELNQELLRKATEGMSIDEFVRKYLKMSYEEFKDKEDDIFDWMLKKKFGVRLEDILRPPEEERR